MTKGTEIKGKKGKHMTKKVNSKRDRRNKWAMKCERNPFFDSPLVNPF